MTFANTLVSKICVQVGDTPKIRFLIQYLHFARCPQQNCGAAVTPDKLPDLQDLISGFTDQRSVLPCLMSPLAIHGENRKWRGGRKGGACIRIGEV